MSPAADPNSVPEFGQRVPAAPGAERIGAYAILAGADGRAAVVRARDGFHLAGGGVEPGESLEQTVVREVREETGLEVRVTGWLGEARQWVTEPASRQATCKWCHYFRTQLVAAHGDASAAGHELVWLSPGAAVAGMAHASHAWALARWHGG